MWGGAGTGATGIAYTGNKRSREMFAEPQYVDALAGEAQRPIRAGELSLSLSSTRRVEFLKPRARGFCHGKKKDPPFSQKPGRETVCTSAN